MREYRINKILLILFLFLEILYVSYADNWVCYDSTGHVTESQLRARFADIGVQPESPLQIIRGVDNKEVVIYTKSNFFRDCGNSNYFKYCPQNEYYLKSIFKARVRCNGFGGTHHQYTGYSNLISGVDCGLGGGPYCLDFKIIGKEDVPSKQYFVCGKNNQSWKFMSSSSNWICPTCKELAIRYNLPPNMGNISSFRDLSFSDENKFSDSKIDLSFMVYILACINRVPMLNLKVDLIDNSTNQLKNTEYGIYAKHETIDYNKENLGMLREFYLPKQKEFKKIYILNATLNGYRAWAWRQRLVDAIKKVVNDKILTVPDYPYNSNKQKFGNLYYSDDFLLNLDKISKVSLKSSAKINKIKQLPLNVLKLVNIPNHEMCTVDDLKNYFNKFGITNDLKNEISKVFPLAKGENINSIEIKKSNDLKVPLIYSDIKLITTDKNEADKIIVALNRKLDLSDFDKYGILKKDKILNDLKSIVSGWFDYSKNVDCSNYNYEIKKVFLNNYDYSYSKKYDKVKKVTYYKFIFNKINLTGIWNNNIIASIKINYSKKVNTEYSWNFATLGQLEPIYLAKCLYNWDECILNKVKDSDHTYFEVADCGLGPDSDLAEPSMKDGARGNKTISQKIIVYRKCDIGNKWISKNKVYSCYNGTYYKCGFNVDSSEVILGVKQAKIGNVINKGNGNAFVCTAPGIWKNISCNINY